MFTKVKNRMNSVLDNNPMINQSYKLKEKIKEVRKGQRIKRMLTLILASFSTVFLSFMASVISYTTPNYYLPITFACSTIAMLINNFVFVGFLKGVRKQDFKYKDASDITSQLITVTISAIILSMLQTFITSIALQITVFSPRLSNFVTTTITLIFMFVSALVAFQIYDGERKYKKLLTNPFKLLKEHFRELLMLSMLYIAFSFIASVAYTSIVYSQLIEVQNINHIIHALLSLKDYATLRTLGLYYLVSFVIGAYLQCDLLLGLGILYDEDSSAKTKVVKKNRKKA